MRRWRRVNVDWDALPLGEIPDAEVARRAGCSNGAVLYQRRKRGIDAYSTRSLDWSGHKLAGATPSELAVAFGVSIQTAYRRLREIGAQRKVISWDEWPLGEFTDEFIAKCAGTSSSNVAKARKKRGIAPHAPPTECVEWSEWPQLGKMSDADVAKMVGTRPINVKRARERRGLSRIVKESECVACGRTIVWREPRKRSVCAGRCARHLESFRKTGLPDELFAAWSVNCELLGRIRERKNGMGNNKQSDG